MRDRTVRRLSALHRMALRATSGRLGRTLPRVGAPMLLLTTKGRRTGKSHSVPLLYLIDGPAYVVIASYGGRDYPPAWYLNLTAEPSAEVEIDGNRLSVAAAATSGDDKRRRQSQAVG